MEEKSFRDKVATIDESGKRIWVFPKMPKGAFYNKRKILSYFLLFFLFAGPHIRISGEPLLLLNILERKFVLLGKVFWPQDFYLFAFAFIIGMVFVVLFTVVFGRLFCGWVCPQTIFMEMLYRRIEFWIDGDRKAQIKLSKEGWTNKKIFKRVLKHSIFYLISFGIANTFLAYIIGSEALWEIQLDNPSEHIGGLALIIVFSGIFYGVFGWMREQVCTTICPYGRLQGVLLDNNTVNVTYDYKRGEPRGFIKKTESDVAPKGDCVDCGLCVQVCPTGIDIRNGTQLECVNCTACMDECDTVMKKVNRPEGLIRYASESSIADQKKWKLNTRAKAYIFLLGFLIIAFTLIVARRETINVSILRAYGTTYKKNAKGNYINFYKFKLVNKSSETHKVGFNIENIPGKITVLGGDSLTIPSNEIKEGTFIIELEESQLEGLKTEVEIGIHSKVGILGGEDVSFSGPLKF